MAAPQQAGVPVYKETSNIRRFDTNRWQDEANNKPGYALAKALGVVMDITEDAAREQKAEDLEEGKQLAMMGVQRENLKEAAGQGGLLSEMGGWTLEGYEMQKGLEDAYIREVELIEAFQNHPASQSDDPRAFEAFMTEQREAILGSLEGSHEMYREGYMSGISESFQSMARSYIKSNSEARLKKKKQALASKTRAALATGSKEQIAAFVDEAPARLGVDHKTAKDVVTEVQAEEIRSGRKTIKDVETKKLSKAQQKVLEDAQTDYDKTQEALRVKRERERILQDAELSAVVGGMVAEDAEAALAKLKETSPEVASALVDRQTDIMSDSDRKGLQQEKYDYYMRNDSLDLTDPAIVKTALEDYLSGMLSDSQYSAIIRTHKATGKANAILSEPGNAEAYSLMAGKVPE